MGVELADEQLGVLLVLELLGRAEAVVLHLLLLHVLVVYLVFELRVGEQAAVIQVARPVQRVVQMRRIGLVFVLSHSEWRLITPCDLSAALDDECGDKNSGNDAEPHQESVQLVRIRKRRFFEVLFL